jgi:hypothetical protein
MNTVYARYSVRGNIAIQMKHLRFGGEKAFIYSVQFVDRVRGSGLNAALRGGNKAAALLFVGTREGLPRSRPCHASL